MKLILQYSFSLNFQNGSLDCECKAKGPKRRSPRDLNRHVDDVDTLIDEIFNGDKWIYSYKYSCNSKNTWINISNQFTENEVTFFANDHYLLNLRGLVILINLVVHVTLAWHVKGRLNRPKKNQNR